MKDIKSWSELYGHRLTVAKSLGTIWDVPIVKDRMTRLRANIKKDDHVLEVGAGNRKYGKMLEKYYAGLYYRSLDVDRKTHQDYYDMNDIKEKFDLIYLFDVIEHLELPDAMQMLKDIRGKLNKGGKVMLSTPNLYHPHQYFGDATHKTFFKYEELGGLLSMAGFDNIKAFRIYRDAFVQSVIKKFIGVYIHKYLNVDFARAVILEGENPSVMEG